MKKLFIRLMRIDLQDNENWRSSILCAEKLLFSIILYTVF